MKQKRGFTLIELLVVVLIIGILSAIALPQYEKAVLKSRAATIIPVLTTMREAQEIYYMENGQYTKDISALNVEMPASCSLIHSPWDPASFNNLFSCGKYFVVDIASGNLPNVGAVANYCPGSTEGWTNCANKRNFQIVQKFAQATEQSNRQYCHPYDSEGTKICKSLTSKSSPESDGNYYF